MSTHIGTGFNGAPGTDKYLVMQNEVSSLRQQVNVLTVELKLTHEWLYEVFKAKIVNPNSTYYKLAHASNFEIDGIKRSLEMDLTKVDFKYDADIEAATKAKAQAMTTSTPTPAAGFEETNTNPKKLASTKYSGGPTSAGGNIISISPAPVKRGRGRPKKLLMPILSPFELPPEALAGLSPKDSASGPPQLQLEEKRPAGTSAIPGKLKTSLTSTTRQYVRRVQTGTKNVAFIDKDKRLTCQNSYKLCSSTAHKRSHERRHRFAEGHEKNLREQTHARNPAEVKPKEKIRPRKCDICPRTFATQAQERYHQLKHAGEKPYKCRHCSATFRSLFLKAYHENNAHTFKTTGEKPAAVCQRYGQSAKTSSHGTSEGRDGGTLSAKDHHGTTLVKMISKTFVK